MDESKLFLMLTERIPSSSDSDTSSWGDIKERLETSEDEENYENDKLFFPLMQYLLRLRRKRGDDYLHIIESWKDSEFKNRLRLSRRTAHQLIDELGNSGFIASHKFGVKPLEPKLCFYIFLSFVANTEPLTPIASRFDISVSSTFRVIRRVIAWILTKLNDVIKWPECYDDIKRICDTFQTKTGISNILGVIDSTHIRIEKPKNGRSYFNTRGYFSIILQGTIDANMRFTNIFCGEPGSSSCLRVLKRSPLYHTASKNRESLFPHNTFLVGHSGYPSLPWLIPPFRENKRLTFQQREFNTLHSSTRKLGNKAFQMLKARFRRIKMFTVYRNTVFIIDTIVAACILHNYCLEENDHFEEQ